MARRRKRLDRMRENPKGWSYADLVPMLERAGFTFASEGGSGSHRWWHHPNGAILGVPDRGHGEVSAVYVKEFLAALEEYGLLQENVSDD